MTTEASIKLYICPHCNEKLPDVEAKKVGNRRYHPKCLEERKSEATEKDIESAHYRELIDYICDLHNIKAPTGMILKQIKEFRDTYGYKNSGILLTLKYFHETLGNSVLDDSGIGIVPYVYEDAKKHYIMKMNVERSLEGYTGDETQEVLVDLHRKMNRNKRSKQIDISSL